MSQLFRTTTRTHGQRSLSDHQVPTLRDDPSYGSTEPAEGKVDRCGIWVPLFLTTVTVVVTAGLGAALLVWLVLHHAVQGQTTWETLVHERAFIVDEGTRNGSDEARLIGLTISSLAVRHTNLSGLQPYSPHRSVG